MGNKSSSKRDLKGTTSVQKRPKKPGPPKERPVTDPGSYAGHYNFNDYGNHDPDLSGRFSGGHPGVSKNPVGADNVQPQEYYPQVPAPKTVPLDVYTRSLDQILKIWPEYESLKNINVHPLGSQVIESLQQVYKRLYEQHTLIAILSKEKHELSLSLQELEEERTALKQRLDVCQPQVNDLNNDVSILKGELRRRGFDVKLPEKNRNGFDKSPRLSRNSRMMSDSSDVFLDTPSQKYASDDNVKGLERRRSYLQPTPMLRAEGREGYGAAIRRSASLRTGISGGYPSSGQPGSIDSGYGYGSKKGVEELNDRIERLQSALDKEKRANFVLEQRLASSDPHSSHRIGTGAVSVEKLTERYRHLEKDAMSKVMRALDHHLGHVNTVRKYKFICASMVCAYKMSADMFERFHQGIRDILLNPILSEMKGFATKKPRYSTAEQDGMSKLAQRTLAYTDIPASLMDQITGFVENMSEFTNLSGLVETVIDELSKDFQECTTPALLNHASFTHYLHECCRTCWQMNVLRPPVYIGTDHGEKYDDRYYDPLPGQGHSRSNEIDFFVWPTLFSKKHGDVLYKGQVSLTTREHF